MPPTRVLVVDDSVVVRRLVTQVLDADPTIEVVGTAVDGRAALHKVAALAPDVITMDIEMPELDGIGAVRELRATGCRTPIVMFSTLSVRGAEATLDALAAGATDYVAKPANVGSVGRSIEQVRDALIPRVKALAAAARPAPVRRLSVVPRVAPVVAGRVTGPAAAARIAAEAPRLVVVGCSTGGPEALAALLRDLPVLPVPVVVVQHMPPVFTTQFAARLDRGSDWSVSEATAGQVLRPGTVAIAPGDHHLEVHARGSDLVARLTQGPRENYCRPAVDVLFRTAAAAVGGAALGVVLTGMGSDGERGSRSLHDAGARVLAQDEATSVVWGMPGAVAAAGLADDVLPLGSLAAEIARRVPRPALAGTIQEVVR